MLLLAQNVSVFVCVQMKAVKADGKFLEANELTSAAEQWAASADDLDQQSITATAAAREASEKAERLQTQVDGHQAELAKLDVLLQQIRRGSQMLSLSKLWERKHQDATAAADKAAAIAQSRRVQV